MATRQRPWLVRRVHKVLKCSNLNTEDIYRAIPTVLWVAGGRIQFDFLFGEGWFLGQPSTPNLRAILETRSPGHWKNLFVHVAVKIGYRTYEAEGNLEKHVTVAGLLHLLTDPVNVRSLLLKGSEFKSAGSLVFGRTRPTAYFSEVPIRPGPMINSFSHWPIITDSRHYPKLAISASSTCSRK